MRKLLQDRNSELSYDDDDTSDLTYDNMLFYINAMHRIFIQETNCTVY